MDIKSSPYGRTTISVLAIVLFSLFSTAAISFIGIAEGQNNTAEISDLSAQLKKLDLYTLIQIVIILVAGFVIARVARTITSKRTKRNFPADYSRKLTLIVYYGIIAITILSALAHSGIDFTALLVAGGVFGIIIGFATQGLVSNLISGIFLYIDKPLKVGDPVMITGKLPDISGVVLGIGVMTSRFRLFDGTYVTLPNTEVFSSEIHNYSGAVARRIEISIGISFNEDIDKAIGVIRNSLSESPLVLVEPEPNVYVDSIGEYAINIMIRCWVPASVLYEMTMKLTNQIKKQLSDNNIQIPLPQRVLHLADKDRLNI